MFIALERLINLSEGYRQPFQVGGRNLLLLMVERQPVLLESRCPHQGAPLHSATVVGRVLRCSRHGIDSGQPLNASCGSLSLYKLAYDGDRIGIDL